MLALGKFCLVRRQDQGQVRESRNLSAKSLVKQNLFVGVREMILSAYDVSDPHLDIIKDDGEIVERMSI